MIRGMSIAGLLILAVLSGCATNSRPASASTSAAKTQDKQSVAEAAAIASALEQLNSSKSSYSISPGDLLNVSIFEQKDIAREVRVGQNGMISLPLIGAVKIEGMSVTEAESVLADKFKDYIINPQVSLFIKEYRNKKLFIMGEVRKPGSVDLPAEANMTVLEAISAAGGFTPIAAPDRTKVIRMVDGKSQTIPVEVSAIMHHGQKQKDFSVQPNDVIYVPQSYF